MDPISITAIIFSIAILGLIIAIPNSVWSTLFRLAFVLGCAWVAYWAFLILILSV